MSAYVSPLAERGLSAKKMAMLHGTEPRIDPALSMTRESLRVPSDLKTSRVHPTAEFSVEERPGLGSTAKNEGVDLAMVPAHVHTYKGGLVKGCNLLLVLLRAPNSS